MLPLSTNNIEWIKGCIRIKAVELKRLAKMNFINIVFNMNEFEFFKLKYKINKLKDVILLDFLKGVYLLFATIYN
jgi:hypothetical protein